MKKNKIRKIIRTFKESGLAKMEFEFEDVVVKLERAGYQNEQPVLPISNESDKKSMWVLSPLVGTFYGAPALDAKPYVSVGDEVQVNDVLCVIEAMKIMNELKCKISGTVVEIAVEDRRMVQYAQPLFRILPHD